MSVVSLMALGLSGVSVFIDLVLVRLLVLAAAIFGLGIVVIATAVTIRFTTNLAIPGWATNVVGITLIMLFQALTLSVLTCLTTLATRSATVFVPAKQAREYIADRSVIVRP